MCISVGSVVVERDDDEMVISCSIMSCGLFSAFLAEGRVPSKLISHHTLASSGDTLIGSFSKCTYKKSKIYSL